MMVQTTYVAEQLRRLTNLEYILLGDVRDLLEEPPTEETRHWLKEVVGALLETVPLEFRLSQIGGYLSEVTAENPCYAVHVESLKAQHRFLVDQLYDIKVRLDESESYEDVALTLRADLANWSRAITSHRHHENRLLQSALFVVDGGGD